MSDLTAATLRSFEYWLHKYRRTWRGSVMYTFVTPLLYLTAIGVGLGSLVNRSGGAAALGGVPYLTFIAPGLLAATAMQVAANESLYPVLSSARWQKSYVAMLATPLGVGNVLLGHLAYIALKLVLGAVAFLVAMAAFGTVHSWQAVLALPVTVLTGLAFAVPLAGYSATQTDDDNFAVVVRVGIVPLFLFSGVFFPVDRMSAALRPLAYATPLWHGVDLCRGLVLGTGLSPGMAALHLAYLAAVVGAGYPVARAAFRRSLLP